MTLTLTIDGIDRTDLIDLTDARIEETATPLNSIMSFTLRDESAVVGDPPIDVRERMEVVFTNGATREFAGQISALDPVLDGLAIEYRVDCQGFDCLLDQRVVESMAGAPNPKVSNVYDDDLVRWLIGTWASGLGLDTGAYVRRVRRNRFDKLPDLSGMTLRAALSTISQRTAGGRAWVDHSKNVHWNSPKSGESVLNGDFEDGAADWTLDGIATVPANGGPGGTGDAALRVDGNGSGTHTSSQTLAAIPAGRRYVVAGDIFASVTGKALIRVDWLNSGGGTISSTALTHDGGNNTWVSLSTVVTAPAGTTKAKVNCLLASGTTATGKWDNVSVIGETAAFGMSTTPDGSTTRALHEWGEPRDASQPVNRVLVRGTGISGWREQWGSIAYYGQVFEGVVDDERVTQQTGIDSRAEDIFAKSAFPASSGHYWTEDAGLKAGDFQIIEIEPLHRTQIAWLATITKTFRGDGRIRYAVTYGVPNDDVAALMVGNSTYSAGETHRRVVSEGTIVDTLTDLSIAGANLVTNSSGESANEGWTTGTGWSVPFANTGAWYGDNTFRLSSSAGGDLVSGAMRVDRTSDYWASVYSLLSSLGGGATWQIVVDEYDASDNRLVTTPFADLSAVEAGWTRHSIHFGDTADAGGRVAFDPATAYVKLRASRTHGGAVVWDLDAWQFERSKVLTSYAPKPGEIPDFSIIAKKIADGIIDTAKFASTIRPVQIVTSLPALPDSSYPVNSVVILTTDGKLYRNVSGTWTRAVDGADLVDASVLAAKIADAQLTTAKFASNVRPVQIVAALPALPDASYPSDRAVVLLQSDGKLYRNIGGTWTKAVDGDDLVDASVVAAKIAAGAIDTAKFASTIRPVQIVTSLPALPDSTYPVSSVVILTTDGKLYRNVAGAWTKAVDGVDLVANSVKTAAIDAGAVTSNELAANAVIAGKIAANAVDSTAVAANAITTTKISDNAITSGKIAANAVVAGHIAAGAIDTVKLTAGFQTFLNNPNPLNAIRNPGFEADAASATYWNGGTFRADSSKARSGNNYLEVSAPASTFALGVANNDAPFLEVNEGDVVFYGGWAYRESGNATYGVRLVPYDKDKGAIAAFPAVYLNTTGAWGQLTSTYTIPAGTKYVQLWLQINNNGTGTTVCRFDDAFLAVQIPGAGIVASSITAAQIAAGTITATELASNSVTAAKILAGAVTTAKIAAGAVTANEIAADTITAGQIAAGAVGASEIAAGAVAAGKIAAGAVTATEIAAATITGGKIAAATITGTNIAAATIDASNIVADSLTAGVIAAGAIGASEIAAGAVTTPKLAAGAVTANEITAATITGAKIAAATIAGSNIAANTITAGNIAADTLTAGEIAAGAIGASEIAAGAVVAGKIAANAVTATEIAAGSVTTGKLAASAVTANEIAAATITGAKLAANTITADKLLIGAHNGGAAISNPNFGTAFNAPTLTGWSQNKNDDAGSTFAAATDATAPGGTTGQVTRTASGTQASLDANNGTYSIPVIAGQGVTASIWARVQAGTPTANNVALTVHFAKQDGTYAGNITRLVSVTATGARITASGVAPAGAVMGYFQLANRGASQTIGFTDARISAEQNVAAAGGSVTVDSGGVTITNGAITVKNPGGTVIIDGTSNMFKILSTGTKSVTMSNTAAFNAVTASTTFTGLGTFAAPCAHMSFIADGTGVTAAKFGDFDVYTADPNSNFIRTATGVGGAGQAWSGFLIPTIILQVASQLNGSNQERMDLIVQCGEDLTGLTFNARWYVLAEVAF